MALKSNRSLLRKGQMRPTTAAMASKGIYGNGGAYGNGSVSRKNWTKSENLIVADDVDVVWAARNGSAVELSRDPSIKTQELPVILPG